MRKKTTIEDIEFDKVTPELIEWEDIHTIGDGWIDYGDIKHDCPQMKTVGYVVKEDDNYVTVVQTIADDYELLNGLVIPKKVIKNRKRLK